MSEAQADKWTKLFRSTSAPESFTHDLRKLLGLGPEARDAIVSVLAKRDFVLDETSQKELDRLEEVVQDHARGDLGDAADVLTFLIKKVSLQSLSLDELSADLGSLGYSTDDIETVKSCVTRVLDLRPRESIEANARKVVAANRILDSVSDLDFSMEVRGVPDEDGEVVDIVPVLLVRMKLSNDQSDDVVFQLSGKKLNQFCELFENQRKRLDAFAKRIKLDSPESEV